MTPLSMYTEKFLTKQIITSLQTLKFCQDQHNFSLSQQSLIEFPVELFEET